VSAGRIFGDDRAIRERLRRRSHLIRLRTSSINRTFGLLTQWGLRRNLTALRRPGAQDRPVARGRRAAARALIPDLFVHDTSKAQSLEKAFVEELDRTQPLPAAERQLMVGWLREVMQGLVTANKPMLQREKTITVLHLPSQREETLHDFTGIADLEAARIDVRQRVASLASQSPSTRAALAELLVTYLDANLAQDTAATLQRRDQAERAVLPVQVRVPKGTVLIAGGHQFPCAFVNGDLRCGIDAIDTAELYDPVTGTFATTGSKTSPRQRRTSTRPGAASTKRGPTFPAPRRPGSSPRTRS
jgi:hypothetical protein